MPASTITSEPSSSPSLPPDNVLCQVALLKTFAHLLGSPELREQAQMVVELLARRHAEAGLEIMEQFVNALVAVSPIRTVPQEELTILNRGVEAILGGTQWLRSDQHSAATVATKQSRAMNVAYLGKRWKTEGRVFAISRRGRDYFPRYAFDDAFEPLPALRDVLRAMKGRSGWAIAAWFESPSSFLGGQRPRELVANHPKRVLDAALDFVE